MPLDIRRARHLISALRCAERVLFEQARACDFSERLSILGHRNVIVAHIVDLETLLKDAEERESCGK